MSENHERLAVDRLRSLLTPESDATLAEMIQHRDSVLARYRPIFSPDQVHDLTQEQFLSFLQFENNKHWTGLNRKGHRACADINSLRKYLTFLVDESKPLVDRLNRVADEVPGMGKALITAILTVTYPDKYGVWNGTSEAALKSLDVWPEFERGATFGARYLLVNQTLLDLAADLGIDLWTVDALFWRLPNAEGPQGNGELPSLSEAQSVPTPNGEAQRFALERHLHDFLRDNWERTLLGKEWEIYSEQGEPEAGYEFPTEVGRIDLLAKHRKTQRWLVVELKRAQSSDDTVGQVLRYMGWVRRKLAEPRDAVEGLIICRDADESLRYAVSEIPGVKVMVYEVSFSLQPDPKSFERQT